MNSEHTEEKAYILGTDVAELHRLGFQHRVWAQTAYALWERAGFQRGQTLLDLGSGPGYDAIDMAHIVGPEGKIIAVDKSEVFLSSLELFMKQQHLSNIEVVHSDFHELQPANDSLDGAYSRWALGWVAQADDVVRRVAPALKRGGAFAAQEYIQWSTLMMYPHSRAHARIVHACLESWTQAEGEINIGGDLPRMFHECGLEVTHFAPLARTGRPNSMEWNWVKTFFHSYVPRLIKTGLLAESDFEEWKHEQKELDSNPNAFVVCPLMIEIIGVKI